MGGVRFDCVDNPLGAIRVLFEAACQQKKVEELGRDDWGVTRTFQNALSNIVDDGKVCILRGFGNIFVLVFFKIY